MGDGATLVKDAVDFLGATGIKLHPWLNIYFKDCFWNWIPNSYASTFTLEEARYYKDGVKPEIPIAISKDPDFEEFKLKPTSHICHSRLCWAFLHIILDEMEDATRHLAEVKEEIDLAVEQAWILPRYQKGFHYLRQGLEAFKMSLELAKGKVNENDFRVYLNSCLRYDDLPKETLVGLKGTKVFFYRSIRFDRLEQIRLLKEICEEDPHSVAWMLTLVIFLRDKRRELCYQSYPSLQEKFWLTKCVETNPDCVMVKLALVRFLGETVQSRGWEVEEGPLELRDKELLYEYATNVQAYLETTMSCDDVKKALEHSPAANLHIAEVIMGLPKGLRDVEFAEKCLKRAAELSPEGSKPYHRLGILYRKEHNFEEALKYTLKALECDQRNFPAIMEVLKLMLQNLDKYGDELRRRLASELGNPDWTDSQRGNLYVLFGVLCHLEGDTENCIQQWKIAYSTSPESLQKELKSLQMHLRNKREIVRLLESEIRKDDPNTFPFFKEAIRTIDLISKGKGYTDAFSFDNWRNDVASLIQC